MKKNGNYSSRQWDKRNDTKPRQDKDRDEKIASYVFGRNAVKELLEGERDIEKIYVQSGEREGSINLLIGIARERKITLVEVDRKKLDQMVGNGRHQGVVAIPSEINYASVDEILDYAYSLNEKPTVIILDGVEDPHNLGAIIRSAECLGAHGIIIPKRRAVGLNSTVAKVSAGAIEHIKVARVTNIAQTIDELKEKGMWFYAADMDGESIYSTEISGSVGIVMGSEGFGVSRLVKEKCDYVISIPMYGSVNSMNVSCAAAVILSQVAKNKH